MKDAGSGFKSEQKLRLYSFLYFHYFAKPESYRASLESLPVILFYTLENSYGTFCDK